MFKAQKMCCGCSACVASCPKSCLTLKQNTNGFYVPSFNPGSCIDCDLCLKVCPITKKEVHSAINKAYGAVTKDKNVSNLSSSGGLFSVFANTILEKNGVVFGAAFDKDFKVYHKAAYTYDDVKAFRGSKYVQSNIEDCFKQVKSLLDDDRYVYFSGTPCQIAGLISYLNKDYSKLITQDFICHSIPSPMVWDRFMTYKEKEFGGKIVYASFREKEEEQKGYKLKLLFDNGNTYIGDGNNPYTKAFIEGLSSNTACYNCKFKGDNRFSDITLGDFWGVEDICTDFKDYNGVSLILLHNEKALSLFDTVKNDITFVEVDSDKVFNNNQMAIKSVYFNPRRKTFFKTIKKKGFQTAYKKATTPTAKMKLKRLVKKYFI